MFYDMEGNPISLREWSHIFENADRRIAEDIIVQGEHITRVSTVYLGLDHSTVSLERDGESHIPIIFETMMFSSDSDIDTKMWRYATKEQAQKGHVDALADLVLQEESNDR